MNKFILFTVITALVVSCTKQQRSQDTFNIELAVLIDVTDHHLVYPDANTLLEFAGITPDTYKGIRITLSTITDGDYTETLLCTLPKENSLTSNKDRRKLRVKQFTKELSSQLTKLTKRDSIKKAKSIIFRTCAKTLNTFSKTSAPQTGSNVKVCIIYSDLLEHSNISFYEPETIEKLAKDPATIATALEQQNPLEDLHGITVFLVYKAPDYNENEAYVKRSHVFAHILRNHGAEVYTGSLPPAFIHP